MPLRIGTAVPGFVHVRHDVEDSKGFSEVPCWIKALSLDHICVWSTGIGGNFHRGADGILLGNWYSMNFYGPHGMEQQRIEMQEGRLHAVKITGDPHVPPDHWTWRAMGPIKPGQHVEAQVQVRENPTDPHGFHVIPAKLFVVNAATLQLTCGSHTGTFLGIPKPEFAAMGAFTRDDGTGSSGYAQGQVDLLTGSSGKRRCTSKWKHQAWNFTTVSPGTHAFEAFQALPQRAWHGAPPNSINGRFEVRMMPGSDGLASTLVPDSCISGTVRNGDSIAWCTSDTLPTLDGRVTPDGSLMWRLGTLVLRSAPGQGHRLARDRGGYLDFTGADTQTNSLHAWRLYVVIAADEVDQWTSPQDQFLALLMGTHTRLGANSGVSHLGSGVLKIIQSFVKRAPIWADLEREVEQAGLHFCDRSLSPAQLVHQYRAFLALKVEREDWMSLELSPPMIAHNGKRLIDEVWHLHIAMRSYEEDCALLSSGHIIMHQPVLLEQALDRYRRTYALYCARSAARGDEIDHRCWPNPHLHVTTPSNWDGGCC
eukprot:CAMPEP_0172682962 /NCGR_PEP_ID=MMETSP1074-20121228/18515_1 /TAXON_ID=2916 /ORGANISM="Ceratium fusus, Strain PA161109" /LENGTH=537 /DNA_ID=CAMNT_0013501733 /DNA_START=129 /DNA_END=1742 /DNA_ORIENTATION=+